MARVLSLLTLGSLFSTLDSLLSARPPRLLVWLGDLVSVIRVGVILGLLVRTLELGVATVESLFRVLVLAATLVHTLPPLVLEQLQKPLEGLSSSNIDNNNNNNIMPSSLEALKAHSIVVADTGDFESIARFKPQGSRAATSRTSRTSHKLTSSHNVTNTL